MKETMIALLLPFFVGCSSTIDKIVDAEAKFINGYCKVVGEDQAKVRMYHDVKLRGAGAKGVVRVICD